jgi:cbb3-type cytochrome oxidase maturation protein
MEIIYFLIPIALVLVAGIVAGLFWAVKSGQFDDMEGPAHQILMDEEVYPEKKTDKNKADKQKQQKK